MCSLQQVDVDVQIHAVDNTGGSVSAVDLLIGTAVLDFLQEAVLDFLQEVPGIDDLIAQWIVETVKKTVETVENALDWKGEIDFSWQTWQSWM